MMRPLFFGGSERQLFGAYHPPLQPRAIAHAALLCAPGPQEYMHTHWAYRRLATLLSKAGVHVLRFDYFGTGDSSGDVEEGSLDQWQSDIRRAEHVLRELSKAERTSLVGYRLGAALAWRSSGSAAHRPRDLVLWDPVVHGTSYLDELYAAEAAFASRLFYFPKLERPAKELAGYVLPREQRLATERVDLLAEPLPNATRVHLYVGRETQQTQALEQRLRAQLKRFTYEHVPEEGALGSGSLLSTKVLHVIAAALAADGR
jgi:pimeloyl-ACP methyl ester carboxylesterase